MMRLVIICCALALMFGVGGALAQNDKLPPHLAKYASDGKALSKRGEAVMRFFGLKVYDIRLWTQAGVQRDNELFALELVYDVGLSGADIAKRSVEEMRKIGYTDETKLAGWRESMARVFPDIKQGDSLIGVAVPGKEARFYSKDKFIASIADAEFTKAFFGIWLSERTSEPRMRERLLGLKQGITQ